MHKDHDNKYFFVRVRIYQTNEVSARRSEELRIGMLKQSLYIRDGRPPTSASPCCVYIRGCLAHLGYQEETLTSSREKNHQDNYSSKRRQIVVYFSDDGAIHAIAVK